MSEEIVHKNITENPDSIEIGTPSKGGAIKIYLDVDNVEEAKRKIENAKIIKLYGQELLSFEKSL